MKPITSPAAFTAALASLLLAYPGVARTKILQPPSCGIYYQAEPVCTDQPELRRVVLLGSSSAAGGGASSIANSWAGQLANALQYRGFTLVNNSIWGSSTADSINRFDRDVTAYNPEVVILATSTVNEDILHQVEAAKRNFLMNTRRLISMVEDIGAVPVVITPYPNSAFTPQITAALEDITRQLQTEGVIVWDFWNGLGDGSGRWLPELSADGTHPNDIAHRSFFGRIPLGLFDRLVSSNRLASPLYDFGSWVADTGPSQPALSVFPALPAPSWSVAFWTRVGGEDRQKTLMEVHGPEVFIRRIGRRFELLLSDQLVASGDGIEQDGFQHLCLTYQELTGVITMFVNGTLAGSTSLAGLEPARQFTLGSTSGQPGIEGDSAARLLIYRTPLSADDVQELVSGRLPVKSLEAYLPLAQSPARPNQNAAPTIVNTAIAGAWHWQATEPRITAAP